MNQTDRAALERAIAAARAEGPDRAAQIDSMLSDRDWEVVGAFAAYSSQTKSLGLEPWQSPPCCASLADLAKPYGDPRAARESAELLSRLLDAGLSAYEPHPLQALARVERKNRQPAS